MGLWGLGKQLVRGELGCLPEESLRGQHPESLNTSLPEAGALVAGRARGQGAQVLAGLLGPSVGWPHPLGASGMGGGQGGGQGGWWVALARTVPSP